MEESLVIRSRTNDLLRRVGAVLAGKDRGTLALEGDRLIDDAIRAEWELEVVLVAEGRTDRAAELESSGQAVRLVEDKLLERVSALESCPGILGLARTPAETSVSKLKPELARRVLVIAGLQDPGNLGALARSAEAAGFGSIVVVRGGARPFGAKALRGSMGSLFRVAVHGAGSATEAAEVLSAAGYRQVCASTRDGAPWNTFDWSGALALWVGGESGLDPAVMGDFEGVTIPMAGEVESLNITVAASLLLFSAGAAE